MRFLSDPPRSPVAPALISKEASAAHAGKVVTVRMLKDARGQTSHTGHPHVIMAKEGEERPVSDDLARLWVKSGTCEIVTPKEKPEAEATEERKAERKPRRRRGKK